MQPKPATIPEYLDQIPDERRAHVEKLRQAILRYLPSGFDEQISYGMIGYVVPHSIYPSGYHCSPELPLPFISIASQKNFISLYHMGIYADPELLEWFVASYTNLGIGKLDMGKSCIRFKKPEQIPFELIGELASKMSTDQWIATYEKNYRNK